MGFDASGTFVRWGGKDVWKGDSAAGTKILSSRHDDHDQELANGLSLCITRDNKGGPNVDISWRGHKLTNLGPGVELTDAVNVEQLQSRTSFSEAVSITGSDSKGQIRFTGSQSPSADVNNRPLGLSFTQSDLFFGVKPGGYPTVGELPRWIWNDKGDGTGNDVMTLTDDGKLQLINRVPGGNVAPHLSLYRATAPGSPIGYIEWLGHNNGGTALPYGQMYVTVTNGTVGAEASSLVLANMVAGVMVGRLQLHGTGVSVAGALGATGDLSTSANLSVAGSQWVTGNITASGFLQAGQTVQSAATALILATTGAGAVYLRANGAGSDVGQVYVDSAGNLTMPGKLFSGPVSSNSNITAAGAITAGSTLSTSGEIQTPSTIRCGTHILGQNSDIIISANGAAGRNILLRPNLYNSSSEQLTYSNNGNLTIGNQGYKQVAGDWAAASDARIKTVTGDYEVGLDAILALQVRRFTFKGNDVTRQPTEGDPAPAVSDHATVAEAGTEFVGLIAQEAETAMPDIVTQIDAYIDDQQVSDFRILDTTNVLYALVNAVKELAGRLDALEGAPA